MKPLAKEKVPYVFLFIFAVEVMIYYLWQSIPDYALGVIGKEIPMPYGLLWLWTNLPFSSLPLYRLWLSCFLLLGAGVQLFLWNRKKIPYIVIIGNVFTSTLLILISAWQHVTEALWISLAYWNPGFIIWWILSHFPIGNPAGWACDFGPDKLYHVGPDGYLYQYCGPGLFFGSTGLIIWHFLETIWLLPLGIWWVVRLLKWLNKKWTAWSEYA